MLKQPLHQLDPERAEQGDRKLKFTILVIIVLLGLVAYSRMSGAGPGQAIPQHPADAHAYADGILVPLFIGSTNQWIVRHPTDPVGKEYAHCKRLDAGDVKRWKQVRLAFKNLDRALKQAGY